MNLEARKIEFIKQFLKVQNEEVVSRLETLLKNEQINSDSRVVEPMTEYELNRRIDQSEEDFKNNRFKSSSELKVKYEK